MTDVRQSPATAPEGADGPSRPAGSGHVLVVDDLEPVRIVISRSLAALGFTVDTARDGAEAVSLFAANPALYALALVDVKLPGRMSGVDVIGELRQIRPEIPAILTSGYSLGEAMIDSFARVDSVGFLQKPFKVAALASAVRQALEGQLRRESM
jgi:CheY-like chemotaxis protein